MSPFACVKCFAEVCDPQDLQCHAFSFPQDLAHCIAVLDHGPGAGLCDRCRHINTLPLLSRVTGSRKRAVLGAPEGDARLAALVDIAARQFRAEVPGLDIAVARTRQEFKRHFLHQFIGPAAQRMNRFATAKNKLDWVANQRATLDYEFFAAMYLLCSGAVQVYFRPVGDHPADAWFTPSDQAPDDAVNLVHREQALAHHKRQLGTLIGLLLVADGRALRDGATLDALTGRLAQLLPAQLLGDDVLKSIADTVHRHAASLDAGHREFAETRYRIELPLALLCHLNDRPNPRIRQWTEIAFLYELVQGELGEPAVLALPAARLRASFDEAFFWQRFTEYGSRMGFANLTEENRARVARLMECARRVYPEETLARMQFGISKQEGESDEAFLQKALRMIERGFAQGDAVFISRILCGSLQRSAIAMLPRLAQAIAHKSAADAGLAPADRVELLRTCVEALNSAGLTGEASSFAALLQACIDEEDLVRTDPGACAPAYNEIANVLRREGKREQALALYEAALDLLGRDPRDGTSRVALRNRAIVLRELHSYTEAVAACEELAPYAAFGESRQLAVTHATCLLEMGEPSQARALLDKMAQDHGPVPVVKREDLSFLTLQAFLWAQDGELAQAAQLLDPVLPFAASLDEVPALFVAAYVALRRSREEAGPDAAEALATLHGTVQRLRGDALGWKVIAATDQLHAVLCERGRDAEAETLVRELIERIDLASSPRSWQLHLFAAAHAGRRPDPDRYRHDLLAAALALQTALSNLAETDDVRSFIAPQARAVSDLVARLLGLAADGTGDAAVLALQAADLLAAPVSTARLRRRHGLAPGLADPDSERQRLCQLLSDTPAVLWQFVDVDDRVQVVQTMLDGEGRLASRTVSLSTGATAAGKLAGKLAYALFNASASLPDLRFDRFAGWPALRSELADLAAGLPARLPLAVVPGPLDDTIINLAIGHLRPLVFVPSMGALVALRQGRGRPDAAPPAPARLFTFATWFSTEMEEQARTLAQVAAHGAALGERHALAVASASGKEATRQRLLDGLASADLAWLACHGKARRDAGSVDLYVAAQGKLPVRYLDMLVESQRAQHLVNWQELAVLQRAPRLVLSSACDSGLTRRNRGGERLGLERPLFAAGCSMFVAPLWQVPTKEIQSQASAVLEAWLAQPGGSLAEKVWQARIKARQDGLPCLAAEAFAVFGDAL